MLIPFFIGPGSAEHEIAFVKQVALSVGIELQAIASPPLTDNYLCLDLDGAGPRFCLGGSRGPVLALDWVKEYALFQRQVSKTAAGPLKKALGRGLKKGDTVVDATCGTGKDSLLFLSWGLKVLAFERHPLMFLLLQLAWQRLKLAHPELEGKFELHFGDVRWGAQAIREQKISVLYFDPMFAHGPKQRRSLPRQEMVIFAQLIGADLDQAVVMESLLQLPLARIVVKRAGRVPHFRAPLATFAGKSIRYDLFRGL